MLETADFFSNLVHAGELVVERLLPGFSVSDLQSVSRSDHDDVAWELQSLDLPCGQTDAVVGIDVHFLGCGVQNRIQLGLVRGGCETRCGASGCVELVEHRVGVEPKCFGLGPGDAEPCGSVLVGVPPIAELGRDREARFGVDRRVGLSGEWHCVGPRWWSCMGLCPTSTHDATRFTHSCPFWGLNVDREGGSFVWFPEGG